MSNIKNEAVRDDISQPAVVQNGSSKHFEDSLDHVQWITGWRLWIIGIGQGLCLFMVQTELSITGTAIISITNDLGNFAISSWVFTAYLLAYGGFPIILTRLSDILGRKVVWLSCLVLFIIFTGACGASQTLFQLIMFRWITGIGASGVLSIASLYGFDLRPPEKWAQYSAAVISVVTISFAIAPVIGAALSNVGQWRWVFLLNVPLGVVTFLMLSFAAPSKLTQEPASRRRSDIPDGHSKGRTSALRTLDVIGVVTVLGSSILITAALQQAAKGIPFRSAQVIALIVVGGLLSLAFVLWQWLLSSNSRTVSPLLSWEILTNRIFLGMLVDSWLVGAIVAVSIVQIPQRFAVVNGYSILDAGVRLLPFAAVMAVSSILATVIMTRAKIPAVNMLISSGLLMVAGTVGLSKSSTSGQLQAHQYGFQILTGSGVGIMVVVLGILPPYVVERKYIAVTSGAVTQFRLLGSAIGLALVTCVSNPYLSRNLQGILSTEEIKDFLDRPSTLYELAPQKQAALREISGKSYNLQITIMIGFSVATVLFSLLQWQRNAIVIKG
ncbi:MFS general substrate transporter [Pseudovirgaria hyperparasitica]|uniref:MFS general substrate transporter n=1 Tax=Pseudovirgaria hyperparasitica TaxID=470096 RepID=A0A6A6VSL7_9PEZI|nr:MFS general substrate transporter [Pseudovirgaria hyperparasitica]KAF2752776.1 MFS general substrate transporter [Pseudovirgaria hyperparasitica]